MWRSKRTLRGERSERSLGKANEKIDKNFFHLSPYLITHIHKHIILSFTYISHNTHSHARVCIRESDCETGVKG